MVSGLLETQSLPDSSRAFAECVQTQHPKSSSRLQGEEKALSPRSSQPGSVLPTGRTARGAIGLTAAALPAPGRGGVGNGCDKQPRSARERGKKPEAAPWCLDFNKPLNHGCLRRAAQGSEQHPGVLLPKRPLSHMGRPPPPPATGRGAARSMAGRCPSPTEAVGQESHVGGTPRWGSPRAHIPKCWEKRWGCPVLSNRGR